MSRAEHVETSEPAAAPHGAGFAFFARLRPPRLAWMAAFAYAAALLSIGVTRDWRGQAA